MRIGRRPLFFAALAVINLALIPATPAEFRWLNLVMGGLAAFWSVTLGLEELSNAAQGRQTKGE